jgi:hypothetical protein
MYSPTFSCKPIDFHLCQTIVSDAAYVPSSSQEKEEQEQEGEEEPEVLDRFLDPRSKTTFAFDHTSLVRPCQSLHCPYVLSRRSL